MSLLSIVRGRPFLSRKIVSAPLPADIGSSFARVSLATFSCSIACRWISVPEIKPDFVLSFLTGGASFLGGDKSSHFIFLGGEISFLFSLSFP
jgi:hypothetical protein